MQSDYVTVYHACYRCQKKIASNFKGVVDHALLKLFFSFDFKSYLVTHCIHRHILDTEMYLKCLRIQ